jgi:hypothetical protein
MNHWKAFVIWLESYELMLMIYNVVVVFQKINNTLWQIK